MSSVGFLKSRLRGARFDNGEIPVDVLADLIALRDMVLDVARWQYLKTNPDRQRSPPDFNEVNFNLTGIERGSAVPIIKLASSQSTLDGQVPYQNHFEKAMECIVDAIDSVMEGKPPSNEDLPYEKLAYFNRIGRSLRDGESLELSIPTRQTPVRLTSAIRDQVLRLVPTTQSTREVVLRGTVPIIDQKKMTFGLQQIYGPIVSGPVPEQHRDTIMTTLNHYKNHARMLVRGIGKYDQDDRLAHMESISHVSVLRQLDMSAQLDEFRSMKKGWLDGDGIALDHKGLDWLSNIFERYYPDDATLPHTYPTPDGGIDMEWSIGSREIGLEIDLAEHQGEWSWHDVDSGSSEEKTLDLNQSSNWEWVADQIRSMTEMLK